MINKEERKEYYEKNREKILRQRKEYYYKNQNKEKASAKKYGEENKEKIQKYNQIPIVKERNKKVKKKYQEKNKEKIKIKKRKWNQENKEKIRKQHKDYYERNREERRKQIRQYIKKRYEENKKFKMTTTLRNRFHKALKLYSQNGKIMSSKKYGVDYKNIIDHLKPFPKDIQKYEVDHIIPVSWFDLNNPKELKWAFAPENHQWMLRTENRKKSNKFIRVVKK